MGSLRGWSFVVGAAIALGCSGPDPLPPKPVPIASAPPPPPTLLSTASAPVASVDPAPAPAPPPPPPPPVPPPAFTAPFERTAAAGDGEWKPLIPADGGAPALLYKAIVHPHPIKPQVYAAIVAIDLTRTDIELVAGTEEPESKVLPKEARTGLVPAADQADLLVVMNGGFMSKHGKYSMLWGGVELFAPREDACAVAEKKDGSMWIGPWAQIKGKNEELSYYRQTPACLIENGTLHPELDNDYKMRKWGSQNNGQKDTRRSAAGLDSSGKVLYYGLGEWVFAKDLAVAMKAAGAVVAAELDINWSYTRFLIMGKPTPGDPIQVVDTLVPKIEHSKRGYVEKPATRDFFYVKRRKKAP